MSMKASFVMKCSHYSLEWFQFYIFGFAVVRSGHVRIVNSALTTVLSTLVKSIRIVGNNILKEENVRRSGNK